MRHKIAFVVATKDRPEELLRLRRSLALQTRPPDEVVIVAAGQAPLPLDGQEPASIVFRAVRTDLASAARQRNIGLDAVDPQADLVGFLDDDVVLEKDALEEISRFFDSAAPDVGGAAFNLMNHPPLDWPALKRTALAARLGLYGRRAGSVTVSGFQTMIGTVTETAWTEWLPSGASLWRSEVVRRFRFDEWFGGYSYLEDLDFSYRVGRTYRLAVVAPARFLHLQAPGGRGGGYVFGMREVLNRLHFVNKHPELSVAKCRRALAARLLMSLVFALSRREASYAARAFGNAVGLARSAIGSV